MTQDEDQLKLLSIFHYILGGLAILGSLFMVAYLIFLSAMLHSAQFSKGGPPPEIFGWFMGIFMAIPIILGLVFAALLFFTGSFLARRSHYTFCFVIACAECIWMPFGTVLGIFTIITLSRESVKQLFGVV